VGPVESELQKLLVEQGVEFVVLAQAERWRHQQRWRECYCTEVKARTGKWTYKGRDWHAFSFGFARCWLDTKALNAYTAYSADDFLIIAETGEGSALRCRAAAPPDLSSIRAEFYVFPPDLDWTMVFTHEGPIFSKRDWVMTR